jgi:hypothetical protein
MINRKMFHMLEVWEWDDKEQSKQKENFFTIKHSFQEHIHWHWHNAEFIEISICSINKTSSNYQNFVWNVWSILT